MNCHLCETRKPRRYCPALCSQICAVCCGEEREVTIDCPFHCEYLQEARRHEKGSPLPDSPPNRDIPMTDEFLAEHGGLIELVGRALGLAAGEVAGIIDQDMREALEALIRTYRTLQSGLLYESLPTNPLAARIHERFRGFIEDLKAREARQTGIHRIRDAEILGALVFLQYTEFTFNNGRKRGRTFIHALTTMAEGLREEGPSRVIRPLGF